MIQVGSAITYQGRRGKVCCINTFTQQACVMFETGDCQCVPLVRLTLAAGTTAVCSVECSQRCGGLIGGVIA